MEKRNTSFNLQALCVSDAMAMREYMSYFHIREDDNGIMVQRSEKEGFISYKNNLFLVSRDIGRSVSLWMSKGGKSFHHTYNRKIKRLGVTLDMGKNKLMKLQAIRTFLLRLSLLGYREVYFNLSDCMQLEEEPYFGYMKYRYRADELLELSQYAELIGIELVPSIPTLTGFQHLFRRPHYFPGYFDGDEILMPENKAVMNLLEKMVKFCRQAFLSKRIHVGMDMTNGYFGRWWYYRHKGYKPEDEILVSHMNSILQLVKAEGFEKMEAFSDFLFQVSTPIEYRGTYYDKDYTEEREYESLWNDSFHLPEACRKKYRTFVLSDTIQKRLDPNIALHDTCIAFEHEDYFEKVLIGHKMLPNQVAYSLPVKCGNYVPHNKYYIQKMKQIFPVIQKHGVEQLNVMLLADRGGKGSVYSHFPLLSYVANVCYEDDADLLENIMGISVMDYLKLDLADEIQHKNEELICPSEYGMFNDAFIGLYDCHIRQSDEMHYAQCANVLYDIAKRTKELQLLFYNRGLQCEILQHKYALGINTRNAYKAKDKEKLSHLINSRYVVLLKLLEHYAEQIRLEWARENVSYGLEVEELKIGGLLLRLKSQKQRLLEYIDSDIPILELENDILNATCGDYQDQEPIWENDWGFIITANRV